MKVAAPPALTLRSVPAVTESSTIASASARPIATVPPAALASALLDVDAVCVALTLTAPVVVRLCVASPASFALVVTVTSVIAAVAVKASVEPAAPSAPASA